MLGPNLKLNRLDPGVWTHSLTGCSLSSEGRSKRPNHFKVLPQLGRLAWFSMKVFVLQSSAPHATLWAGGVVVSFHIAAAASSIYGPKCDPKV